MIDEDQLDVHQGLFDVLPVKPPGSLITSCSGSAAKNCLSARERLVVLRELRVSRWISGNPWRCGTVLEDSAEPFTRAAEIARKEEK